VLTLKAQRKIIAAIIAVGLLGGAAMPAVVTKADTGNTSVGSFVSQALTEKNLYYYNLAYEKIMKLEEGLEKDTLLSKLASVADSVWTKDIKALLQLIDVMAKEKSGKAYDSLEAKIKDSDIKEIDKQYLYNELYGWGKNTVWTPDYQKAIASVIKVWNEKTETSAVEADKAVNELKIQINKEYIMEQLKEAKTGVGLIPVVLDSKYFDGTANAAYVEKGKSINLDLSKDTKARTVNLKGKFRLMNINAPLATVILEDVDANEITLVDVSSNSLFLKGDTKVQSLIINDKSDNAHVVLQGKATVVSAEVRSGALVEVQPDSAVKASFGKLAINTTSIKTIDLAGDFKTTVVQVQKPAALKVAGVVEKIDVTKDAKDTIITVGKDAKVQELSANIALKVEGTGTLGEVTGPAKSEVVNTLPKTPVTGGTGNTSGVPDNTAPSINTIEVTTAKGKVNIQPGTTGIINLASLVTDAGIETVIQVDVTLDTSVEGQNKDDSKDSVKAILDCTTSGSNLFRTYIGKLEDSLAEIQGYLQEGLKVAALIPVEELKKVGGATLTLIDKAGNKSYYTIVIQ
jgi:hypothetical protein